MLKSLIVLSCCAAGSLWVAAASADRAAQCTPSTTEMRILPAAEGQAVAFELRGPSCLPAGEELTNVQVSWGDGTTSAATATYVTDAATGSAQAQLHATHTYATASCPAKPAPCDNTYRTTFTATTPNDGEVQTGRSWEIGVRAAPLRLSALSPRADHGTIDGPLVRVRTGGTRKRSDLSAVIAWGDGTTDRAKVTGTGHAFTVKARHHYRHTLPRTVRIKVHDATARHTYTAVATVQRQAPVKRLQR